MCLPRYKSGMIQTPRRCATLAALMSSVPRTIDGPLLDSPWTGDGPLPDSPRTRDGPSPDSTRTGDGPLPDSPRRLYRDAVHRSSVLSALSFRRFADIHLPMVVIHCSSVVTDCTIIYSLLACGSQCYCGRNARIIVCHLRKHVTSHRIPSLYLPGRLYRSGSKAEPCGTEHVTAIEDDVSPE